MSWFELIFKIRKQQKIGLDKIENKMRRKNQVKKILQATAIRWVIMKILPIKETVCSKFEHMLY